METLLTLSNPRRRRKHKKSAKRRSRRKMSALQLKYFGKRRRSRRRVLSNPTAPRAKRKYRRSGRARMRMATRRAQRGFMALSARVGSVSKPFSMIGPALTGALGAVAVNSIMSRIPLPPILMTGKMRYVTQAAAAIGLGMLASRFGVGSGVASKMAEGALIVTLNDAIKESAADMGVNLGGMGYYLPGVRSPGPSASGRPAQQMGKYLTGPGSNVRSLQGMRGGMRGRVGNINTFKF